jgi:hypothetical protein
VDGAHARLDHMSIWFGEPSLDWANSRRDGTLLHELGIEMTELTDDSIKGRMPVDGRTRQPGGVLHGGDALDGPDGAQDCGVHATLTHFCTVVSRAS